MARTLKCGEQSFALVHEAFEFATGLLGSFRNVGQYTFAVGTYLGHDFAPLLLGKFEFLFGFAGNIRTTSRRLKRRLFQHSAGFPACITDDLFC